MVANFSMRWQGGMKLSLVSPGEGFEDLSDQHLLGK
jgi:hypothetical protein